MAYTIVNQPEAPASVAAGAGISVEGASSIDVQMVGPYTATIDIQVSNDGTNWVDASSGTGVAAGSWTRVLERPKYLRLNTTAYTSGTPRAFVSVTVG